MQTRNISARNAAPESSRKMGEGQGIAGITRDRVAQVADLKEGVTVTVSEMNRYGDVQAEIRTHGLLNWRAWSFEPDFLADLERNLRYVQQ